MKQLEEDLHQKWFCDRGCLFSVECLLWKIVRMKSKTSTSILTKINDVWMPKNYQDDWVHYQPSGALRMPSTDSRIPSAKGHVCWNNFFNWYFVVFVGKQLPATPALDQWFTTSVLKWKPLFYGRQLRLHVKTLTEKCFLSSLLQTRISATSFLNFFYK